MRSLFIFKTFEGLLAAGGPSDPQSHRPPRILLLDKDYINFMRGFNQEGDARNR
jgi:hypothetical protein